MNYRIIGALLIFAGCGGFGFLLAANHRREETSLRQLIGVLDFMACELQYHLTPLPDLCRQASKETAGVVSSILLGLAGELEDQISPDVASCMRAALTRQKDIPKHANKCLLELGSCLGRFDLNGQLRGLESVRMLCRSELESLTKNRDERLRSYQTLGLCAGAALAILFI